MKEVTHIRRGNKLIELLEGVEMDTETFKTVNLAKKAVRERELTVRAESVQVDHGRLFLANCHQYTSDGQVLPLKEYGWRRQMTEERRKVIEQQGVGVKLSAIDFRRRSATALTKDEILQRRRENVKRAEALAKREVENNEKKEALA